MARTRRYDDRRRVSPAGSGAGAGRRDARAGVTERTGWKGSPCGQPRGRRGAPPLPRAKRALLAVPFVQHLVRHGPSAGAPAAAEDAHSAWSAQ